MKAVVVADQLEDTIPIELSCNSDLVQSYDVLKAFPMGHKDKFYQRILSEQRQGLVDVSQSLPSSLHGDVGNSDEVNGNTAVVVGENDSGVGNGPLLGTQGDSTGAVIGQEVWFNTWPERCDKGENCKTSPRTYNHLSNNTRPIPSKRSDTNHQTVRKISLNEALQNISLAYSPLTKKLHLLSRNANQTQNNCQTHTDQTENEQLLTNGPDNVRTDANKNESCAESLTIMNTDAEPLKRSHRRIQAGSFSSTVSSISDVSPSGSLLDTDTDNLSECSDISFARTCKKKSLMQFFNRNVFASWKSNNNGAVTTGVWNLFNKSGSEANIAESPKHEAIVASSSALIQLKRPSNLPAKTVEEEQKHRDEYEAMLAAAKRKDALNSVAKQKQQKQQLQLEEQQAASTKHFLHTVLPNWDATYNLRKTRDLWWLGLPSSVRGRIWRKAIGNDLHITSQLYNICLARAQTLQHSLTNPNHSPHPSNTPNTTEHTPNNCRTYPSVVRTPHFAKPPQSDPNLVDSIVSCSDSALFCADSLVSRRCSLVSDCASAAVLSVDEQQQANLAAVQLDIARVFPSLCIFQEGGPYSDVLQSLLAAYVCYRPDVGYVQGMAYLAAILTLNLQPTHSFIAFANILNRPLHVAAYTLDEGALSARYRAFERCLAVQLPKLCAHMAAAHLTPDLYLLDWVYTVYARAMPLDVVSRVWDVWLRDGQEEFVFRTALGILHLYQDQLLTMDFLHGSQFLTRLPEDLSSDQLFRSIRLVNTTVGKQNFAQIVHTFTQSDYTNS